MIYIESFILYYGIFLTIVYIVLAILSISAIFDYQYKNKLIKYNQLVSSPFSPSIAVIAPAYNEEVVVVNCVRSLLSLQYFNNKIIIVNDGSTDQTLERLIEAYDLIKVPFLYRQKIPTKKVKGVYVSKKSSLKKLMVIDKDNGGKSDALNVGLNISNDDYFVGVDVDSILHEESLIRLIKPIIESTSKKVIAVGGLVRIINNCEIHKGEILKIRLPKNYFAKIQVIEYIRSFVLGRMAWSKINGLLLVSGALGLFDRKIALKSGGYNTNTITEDLDLIVKMRNQMKGIPHSIVYIPEPLCWTEVPEIFLVLEAQRKRWTRGMIQVLFKNRNFLFNPKHKQVGLISFPYWVLIEWISPIVEVVGISYLLYLIFNYQLNYLYFWSSILSFFLLYFLITTVAIVSENTMFSQYKGIKNTLALIFTASLEPFIFHPLVTYFGFKANLESIFNKKKSWGDLKRVGFNSSKNSD